MSCILSSRHSPHVHAARIAAAIAEGSWCWALPRLQRIGPVWTNLNHLVMELEGIGNYNDKSPLGTLVPSKPNICLQQAKRPYVGRGSCSLPLHKHGNTRSGLLRRRLVRVRCQVWVSSRRYYPIRSSEMWSKVSWCVNRCSQVSGNPCFGRSQDRSQGFMTAVSNFIPVLNDSHMLCPSYCRIRCHLSLTAESTAVSKGLAQCAQLCTGHPDNIDDHHLTYPTWPHRRYREP